jgi:hypothetical protein
MKNVPMQKRTGRNQGEQALSLYRVQRLGQPAIKAGVGDTVIFKNAPNLPGRGLTNSPRTPSPNLYVGGYIFNRTGGDIDFDYVLVDPDGNEFPFNLADSGTSFIPLPDGQNFPITSIGTLAFEAIGIWPLVPLPLNWSVVLRVTSGNPLAGKGLVVWPWASDLSRNLQALIVPVTNTWTELGPGPGRAWQLAANQQKQSSLSGPLYLNFDSIVRTIEQGSEVYQLAGEDISVNEVRGDIVIPIRGTSILDGLEVGFTTEIGDEPSKPLGLVLAYPDKIKVKAKEAQKSAPLYMVVPFAEFDLPADMQ